MWAVVTVLRAIDVHALRCHEIGLYVNLNMDADVLAIRLFHRYGGKACTFKKLIQELRDPIMQKRHKRLFVEFRGSRLVVENLLPDLIELRDTFNRQGCPFVLFTLWRDPVP